MAVVCYVATLSHAHRGRIFIFSSLSLIFLIAHSFLEYSYTGIPVVCSLKL